MTKKECRPLSIGEREVDKTFPANIIKCFLGEGCLSSLPYTARKPGLERTISPRTRARLCRSVPCGVTRSDASAFVRKRPTHKICYQKEAGHSS